MPGNLPMDAYRKKHLVDLRRERLATKRCFAKDGTCNEVIEAHSISVRSLERIADSKMVYVFQPGGDDLDQILSRQTIVPVSKPISQVSTFTGFCAKHDNELFAPIDNQVIVPTDSQCARVLFRTLARNYYDAFRGPQLIEKIAKAQLPNGVDRRREKRYVASRAADMLKAKGTLSTHLEQARRCVMESKPIEVRQLFLRLDRIPEVMCSDVFIPYIDFQGNPLPPFPNAAGGSVESHFVSINVSSDSTGGYVHLAWLPRMYRIESYANSWKKAAWNLNKLYCTIVSYVGNFAFSKNWWNAQSVIRQKALMQYYVHGYFAFHDPGIETRNAMVIAADHRIYTNVAVTQVTDLGQTAHA
jgi:hypothetical protein